MHTTAEGIQLEEQVLWAKVHIPIRLGKVIDNILQTYHIQEHLLPLQPHT